MHIEKEKKNKKKDKRWNNEIMKWFNSFFILSYLLLFSFLFEKNSVFAYSNKNKNLPFFNNNKLNKNKTVIWIVWVENNNKKILF